MTTSSPELTERKGVDNYHAGFAQLTDSGRIEECQSNKCAGFGA